MSIYNQPLLINCVKNFLSIESIIQIFVDNQLVFFDKFCQRLVWLVKYVKLKEKNRLPKKKITPMLIQ